MDCRVDIESSVVEQCSSLILKITRCILLMQKEKTKFTNSDVCPELSVSLKECNGTNQCSDIEVNYQTPEPSTFEIRSLLRSLSDKKELITLLQMRANGACVSVAHAVESVIRVYNVYLSEETSDWKLSLHEIDKAPGSEEKFFLLATVELNISGNVHQFKNSILSFLKKSQVLRPHLSITCKSLSGSFHRMGVPGLQVGSIWRDNFVHYLRLTAPRGIYIDTKLQEKVLEGPPEKPVTVSLIYSRVPDTRIGMKNHLHVLFYNEEGFPLPVERSVWDNHVQITVPKDIQLARNPEICASSADVCYSLQRQDTLPECYVLILVFGGSSDINSLLMRHGISVGYAVREAVITMLKSGKQQEEDRQWCHQVASCIGEFLRFSLNEQFRENCLGMLEASNANDFEEKLEARLWGWCLDPSAQPLPSTQQRVGHKRSRSGQPKSMNSVDHACLTAASSSTSTNVPDGFQSTSNSRHCCSNWSLPVEHEVEEESDEDRKRARIFEEWDSMRVNPSEQLHRLRSL